MININDCFYSPEKQGIFLVTGFVGKSIIIRTLYKVIPGASNYHDQMQLGYYSKGNRVCHHAYLAGEQSINAEVFFRIEKLLELNYLVCRAFITSAEKLTTGNTKVAITPYWLLLNNKCGDINISRRNLYITEYGPIYAFDYVNEEIYQRIKTNFDSNIKLIDDIWPK